MKKIIIIFIYFLFLQPSWAKPLKICATTPDLGSLAQEIIGKDIQLTIFARGSEDPHFVEPKPSFVKALSEADVLIQNGLGLEEGWIPTLFENARNAKILRGGEGHIDASIAIIPLGIPKGVVDRTLGDVHSRGNPHYLPDPINGLRVARLLKERFSQINPHQKTAYEKNYQKFSDTLSRMLVGEPLSKKYPIEKMAKLFRFGKLEAFLLNQKEGDLFSGWFQRMASFHKKSVVVDHNNWIYLNHRLGIKTLASLEKKPGISPSTRHLRQVIKQMQSEKIDLIFSSAYYNPRYATFVSEKTGARVLSLANQVKSRSSVTTYLEMIEYNFKVLLEGLKVSPSSQRS